MLNTMELFDLEDQIREELDDRLTQILTLLNRTNRLEELLNLLGMEDLLHKTSGYEPHKNGKIVVIGQPAVKKEVLLAVANTLGIDKTRFEMHLEYDDSKNFDFRKMQYQPTYSLIMVGPMPHSGANKSDYSSVIASIEQQPGYPPVVRLGSNELKITKSDFKAKLEEALRQNKIAA